MKTMPQQHGHNYWKTSCIFLILTLTFVLYRCMPMILPKSFVGLHASHTTELRGSDQLWIPLAKTHSHNDEKQLIPVHHALRNGFCSIEADVFLFGQKIHIGHLIPTLHTLESMYLRALFRVADSSNGYVYPISEKLGVCDQITLLVDMKTPPNITWDVLEDTLNEFEASMGVRVFERYSRQDGRIVRTAKNGFKLNPRPPIKVVVSGVPDDEIESFATHMAQCLSNNCYRSSTLDARDTHTDNYSVRIAQSWISRRYTDVFSWPLPEDPTERENEIEKIRDFIRAVHSNDSPVRTPLARFWATPEDPELWQLLLDLGVDLISTDRLDKLRDFMQSTGPSP